jgi:hypothetical protein
MLCRTRTLYEDEHCKGRKAKGTLTLARMNIHNVLIYIFKKCSFLPFLGEILRNFVSNRPKIGYFLVILVYMCIYVMICQHPKFLPCHWFRVLAKLEHYVMFVLENVDKCWTLIIDPDAPKNVMPGQTLTRTLTGTLTWSKHYDSCS